MKKIVFLLILIGLIQGQLVVQTIFAQHNPSELTRTIPNNQGTEMEQRALNDTSVPF